jgi:LemA protein
MFRGQAMRRNRTVIIAAIVLAFLGIWTAGCYNKMVKLNEEAKTQHSNIKAQLQRRADLIPNLVNTVKGYASHEKEVLKSIADARSKLSGASTTEEALKADSELSKVLSRLLVIVERYPDLKANENFKDLQIQLEGTENRIAVARKDYNDAAKAYNTTIKRFPGVVFSKVFGFNELQYFEVTPGSENPPEVNLRD